MAPSAELLDRLLAASITAAAVSTASPAEATSLAAARRRGRRAPPAADAAAATIARTTAPRVLQADLPTFSLRRVRSEARQIGQRARRGPP